MRKMLALLTAAMMLNGCTTAVPSASVPSVKDSSALLMRPSGPHDILVNVLVQGEAARETGDGEQLQQAALTLRALGATPAQGNEDLASAWLTQAMTFGAKPASTLPYRGRALGSAYKRGEIDRGDVFAMQQMFLAGERARISVVPGRGAALTLTVADEAGKTLCEKVVGQPHASCDWLPVFTGRFRITVHNSGDAKAGFYLVVN